MSDLTYEVDQVMAKYILDYALDHYDEGWDFVYECYSKQDVIDFVKQDGHYISNKEALCRFSNFVTIYNDVRDDIRNA